MSAFSIPSIIHDGAQGRALRRRAVAALLLALLFHLCFFVVWEKASGIPLLARLAELTPETPKPPLQLVVVDEDLLDEALPPEERARLRGRVSRASRGEVANRALPVTGPSGEKEQPHDVFKPGETSPLDRGAPGAPAPAPQAATAPTAPAPQAAPAVPPQPQTPPTPTAPEKPENPESPEIPDNPEKPEAPQKTEAPTAREKPANPESPEAPEAPELPETPPPPPAAPAPATPPPTEAPLLALAQPRPEPTPAKPTPQPEATPRAPAPPETRETQPRERAAKPQERPQKPRTAPERPAPPEPTPAPAPALEATPPAPPAIAATPPAPARPRRPVPTRRIGGGAPANGGALRRSGGRAAMQASAQSLAVLRDRYGEYMDKVLRRIQQAIYIQQQIMPMMFNQGAVVMTFTIDASGRLQAIRHVATAPEGLVQERAAARQVLEDVRNGEPLPRPTPEMLADPDFQKITINFIFAPL